MSGADRERPVDRAAAGLVAAAAIGLVAFGLRFAVILLSPGGASGIVGYDPGVYFAAADAFLHGRSPYADFVLLHPPGIMLALVPFAALGRLTTDHTGFVVANTAFELIGAANAVLVWLVARRLGCGRVAALTGGLFYAIWLGAAEAEASIRLEPLSSCAFLVGLLAMSGEGGPSRRRSLVAGAALACACSIKVWWVVPVAVLVAWHLSRPHRRPAVRWLLAGGAAFGLLVNGPFLIAAPRAMWRMVVTDQLGRGAFVDPVARLDRLTGLQSAFPLLGGGAEAVALTVIVGVVVAAATAAWRLPAARIIVVVLAAQLLVLAISPSFFNFYAGYPAGALALVLAAAMQARVDARRWRWSPLGGIALPAAVGLTIIALLRPVSLTAPFPASRLAVAAKSARCLMADSPGALIDLDALSRDLANGCRNWVDVTGRTYDVDAGRGAAGVARATNSRWQRDLRRYLLSGDAVLIVRPATGYSAATRRAIAHHRRLASAGGYVIYATR